MTSTIKRRPRGYRTAISSEVFEFVMKLLRDTLGTTGRYLDLMRRNAPLRIQGPGYRGLVDTPMQVGFLGSPFQLPYVPRQFYRDGANSARYYRGSNHVQHIEYRQHIDSHYNHPWVPVPLNHGSLVPFRHTYNASRII